MATNDQRSFSVLLRRSRIAAGLTQEALAERSGLSVRGVSDLERGTRQTPRLETLRLLIEALQLDPEGQVALRAAAFGPDVPSPTDQPVPHLHTRATDHAHLPLVQTFLVADIRGYTHFTQEHGDEVAARLASIFAQVVREAAEEYGGRLVELRGDEALLAFLSVRAALRAAIDLQARCIALTTQNPALPLPIGIGLDAGEAVPVEAGFRGSALNLAARLCSQAQQGEVLVSETVATLAGTVEGIAYIERGTAQLKGFDQPVLVLQVVPVGSASAAHGPAGGRMPEGQMASEQRLPIGGFLGALPDAALVAREAEVTRCALLLDAASRGMGRLVLLAGEPGVGKTRLGQEITAAAYTRGFLIASGRCYEPQQSVAYYPFLEALGAAYDAAPTSIRLDLLRRWPDVLRLLPIQLLVQHALPHGSDSPTQDWREKEQRLFWAVTGFVQALAEWRPVALLLDDLHWADKASLDLLQHLARHTCSSRVLLVGAYRDVEITRQHPLEAALRDLGREKLVERIAVRRLSKDATAAQAAAMLGGQVADELADLLYQRTEGNPFFTQELLLQLIERGDVHQQEGRWEGRGIEAELVPESVRSVIGQRLAHLRPQTQELLQEASVLGQTFAFEDVRNLYDRGESEVETALEEATSTGLLHDLGDDRLGFQHALIQQTLYGELPGRRRRRLHRAAAEALERLPARGRDRRAGELAWHFLRADEGAHALPYALQAGDQARAVYAYAEAERHYEVARDLARDLDDREREVVALVKLGGVLDIVARYDEALQVFDEAIALYRAMDNVEAVKEITAKMGEVHASRGVPTEGMRRIEELLETVDATHPTPELAYLHEVLSYLFRVTGRHREQLAAAERAVGLGYVCPADWSWMLAMAQVNQGLALCMLGETDEALRVLRDAIPLCGDEDQVTNEDRVTLAHLYDSMAEAYLTRGEFDAATRCAHHALTCVESIEDQMLSILMSLACIEIAFYRGEWDQARTQCEHPLAVSQQMGAWAQVAYLLFQRGRLALVQGHVEAATQELEAITQTDHGDDVRILRGRFDCGCVPQLPRVELGRGSLVLRGTHAALAEYDLLRGDPAAAHARLAPLLDREGLAERDVTLLLPVLGWAQLGSGETQQAARTIAEAESRARAQHNDLALVDVLRVKTLLAMQEGDERAAGAAVEESLLHCRHMPYPYAEAKALYAYGQLHAARAEPEEAREKYEQALAICERLGEGLYRPSIERALAVLPSS